MPKRNDQPQPWRNVCNGLTITGRDISSIAVHLSVELADRLEAYQQEVADCFDFDSGVQVADLHLASLLQEAASFQAFGDYPTDPNRGLLLRGALALRLIDETVEAIQAERPTCHVILAWDRMTDACRELLAWVLVDLAGDDGAVRSRLARQAAIAKHSSSEYAHIRSVARECYLRWIEKPASYPSLASFARDIVDKFPGQIKNPITVERWVRSWRDQEI